MRRITTLLLLTIAAGGCLWLDAANCRGAQEVKGPPVKPTGAPNAEKLGWHLGCQAWTFNSGTFFQAVDKTAALGLKCIEAFPGQRIGEGAEGKMGPGMSADAIAAVKKKLAARKVKLLNFGVTGIPGKEADARKMFDWARTMGIQTLVTESNHDFYDKLCDEYKINIAFHNHPNSWPPDKVLEATKGRSKRIGACADTGHWMRAKFVPVDTVRKLKGRIISFHLKDLNEFGRGHDVPWGTGKGDVKAVLAEMHKQGFKGVFSIEYEHRFSLADLARCVKHFNDCAKQIAAEAKSR